MSHISVAELAMWQQAGFVHTLLDVRRSAKRQIDGDEIPDGAWRDPTLWLDWKDAVPSDRPAVLYCAYGHEISQGLAAALRALGVDARHLVDGIEGWRQASLAVRPVAPAALTFRDAG
jgi:thiosulfate sulfurtransferase